MHDPVLWVCAATAVCVLFVFGVLESDGVRGRLNGSDPTGFRGRCVGKALGGGVFLLGAGICAVVLGLDAGSAGVGPARLGASVGWTAAYLLVFAPIVGFASSRPGSWRFAPELRRQEYRAPELVALVGAWSAYLLGYELFFRGVLTFVLVDAIGQVSGLAVMTSLYALAHLTKRPSEAFGTLLIGPLWGWIALECGAFWPILVAHLVTALTSELVAAVANPDIRVLPRP